MWAGYGIATCGTPENYETSRSLVKFDLGAIPSVAYIHDASLHIRTYGTCYQGAQTPRTATVYRITSGWSESLVTWANQPALGEAHSSAPIPAESSIWHSFDVTHLVRDWVDGTLPNHGVAIRGPEGTASDPAWIGFFTSDSGSVPYLEVTHAAPPE
jgi:hypothetical protein